MLENPLLIPGLLGVLVVLQLLVLVALSRLSGRVSRLARSNPAPSSPDGRGTAPAKEAAGESGKWFERFLEEDPARRDLPKKEQFAAFRRWRDEQGLNWKSPAGPE
jgi:hypothetical protein